MRHARHLGKLSPKAEGPYRVVAVKGLLGQRVAITPEGGFSKRQRSMLEVHASQLTPYLGVYREPDVIVDEGSWEEAAEEIAPASRHWRVDQAVGATPGRGSCSRRSVAGRGGS